MQLSLPKNIFVNLPLDGMSNKFFMGSELFHDTQPVMNREVDSFAMMSVLVTNEYFLGYLENKQAEGNHWGRIFFNPENGKPSGIEWIESGLAEKLKTADLTVRKLVPKMEEFLSRFNAGNTMMTGVQNLYSAHPLLGKDNPVVNVTWFEAMAFALEAGGRLPYEHEWEYAARAGFSGDSMFSTYNRKLGNNSQSGFDTTAPVRRYAPNAWGLFDMTGNVWEWTNSWYTLRYDMPPKKCANRVLRGGSFLYTDYSVNNVAYRIADDPMSFKKDYGFRIARDILIEEAP